MIDKDKIIPTIMKKILTLEINHYIDLRTYKRNRSLIIIKLSNNQFRLIENGYNKEEIVIPNEKLEKELKVIIKREFPRSNKIRLYNMGYYREETQIFINRKKI